MEEGKPRTPRRAVLLLCVCIAASAEGSENLGTLEDPALRLPPTKWAARAKCQSVICERAQIVSVVLRLQDRKRSSINAA